MRTLGETVRLDARTKLLNPKWYEGMLSSGYEGVREIQKRLTNTMGWSATSGMVDNWVYDEANATFIEDDAMAQVRVCVGGVGGAAGSVGGDGGCVVGCGRVGCGEGGAAQCKARLNWEGSVGLGLLASSMLWPRNSKPLRAASARFQSQPFQPTTQSWLTLPCPVPSRCSPQRLMDANPNSFRKLVATFLEANGRGYWDAKPEQLEKLRQMYMDVEDKIEGVDA